MSESHSITQTYLKEILDYDQEGYLVWKVKKAPWIEIGSRAGNLRREGYTRICINQKNHYLHRLVWIWHYGELPKCDIDHIDGNPSNNKIENLRLATRSQNMYNAVKKKQVTSSKYKGVCFIKRSNKWRALINFEKTTISMGHFLTELEAAKAYNDGAIKYFGKFARLNDV